MPFRCSIPKHLHRNVDQNKYGSGAKKAAILCRIERDTLEGVTEPTASEQSKVAHTLVQSDNTVQVLAMTLAEVHVQFTSQRGYWCLRGRAYRPP